MVTAFIVVSLCLLAGRSFGVRELTQAAPSPTPTANASRNVETLRGALQDVEGKTGRPVSYKNLEAALHIAYASGDMKVPEEPSTIRQLSNTDSMLLAWQNSSASAIMAFTATGARRNFNVTEAGFAPNSVDRLLRGDFEGAYPDTQSPGGFLELAAGNGPRNLPLKDLVANISSDSEVRRVVCTGYGDGGALAQLCGIWAAVTYPSAQVRVIAFGAPVVGNVEFSFALQEMVDLSYLWSISTDLRTTNSTSGGRGPAEPVYLLNDADSKGNEDLVPNSFDAYVAAIVEYATVTSGDSSLIQGNSDVNEDRGGIRGFFDDVKDGIEDVKDVAGAVVGNLDRFGDILDAIKTFAYKGDEEEATEQSNIDAAMEAKAQAEGCPPILCKVRPANDAACSAYQNGTGTIGPGSVTVGPVEETATQVAVNWNATSKTATFAFRGTASQAGWLQDFKVALEEANTNTALDQFFPDVKIHNGFLGAVLSVTQEAKSPKVNITAVLNDLAGGTADPTRVIITGHSLGAALASVAAPWAALTWPKADVRVVTFGAPYPGNSQFAEVYKLLAGRQNRMVHALDVVPSLPPLNNYAPLDYGRWAKGNKSVILEERPERQLDEYNWNDHSCRQYQVSMYLTPYVTAPKNVEAALEDSTTATGGSPSTTRDSAGTSAASHSSSRLAVIFGIIAGVGAGIAAAFGTL